MEEQTRMTLIQMLPMEVRAYVSLHKALPEYKAFVALRRFVLKLVLVLRNLKKAPVRPTHLFEERSPSSEQPEEPEPDEAELLQRLMETDDVVEQV